MKFRLFGPVLVLVLLVALNGAIVTFDATSSASKAEAASQADKNSAPAVAQAARTQPIIIDHTTTDIAAIPQSWIEEAKRTLHIGYGHTSHGSQLTVGMLGLVGFANGGGLALSLPDDIFAWNNGGTGGALDLHDYAMGGDVGYYPQWVNNTISYLGTPDPGTGRGTNHPDVNVIIWSWCGQASGKTEATMLSEYLTPMSQLEADYPGVTFVYMTGHSDGTGESGNLHQRNQQIRDYCIANNKVLYDFYSIELYDPDGNYYGDKAVNDNCDYDSDGNGSRDRNWAEDWQTTHTQNVDWYSCSCAHSKALNCNQKAYAVWWLWARLAGWDGVTAGESAKTASKEIAEHGDLVTYTLTIGDLGAPLTATVHLTDVVPVGLTYVPGTLTASSGATTDADAPTLRWTGLLTPTPAVTVTYAVSVSTTTPQTITNNAHIGAVGYPAITRTATVVVTPTAGQPNLTPSYKAVTPLYADYGEPVTYTVVIHNASGPLSSAVFLTDTVPTGLAYLPGTLTATTGAVSDIDVPTLHWSGVLSPTPAVTVTYAATVTHILSGTIIIIAPRVVTNTAVIAAPGYEPITRTATLRANWQHLYLPLVTRNL